MFFTAAFHINIKTVRPARVGQNIQIRTGLKRLFFGVPVYA